MKIINSLYICIATSLAKRWFKRYDRVYVEQGALHAAVLIHDECATNVFKEWRRYENVECLKLPKEFQPERHWGRNFLEAEKPTRNKQLHKLLKKLTETLGTKPYYETYADSINLQRWSWYK